MGLKYELSLCKMLLINEKLRNKKRKDVGITLTYTMETKQRIYLV